MVTLLPKHSPVYLHIYVPVLPVVTVTQTQSSKFAFKLDVFVSLLPAVTCVTLLPKYSPVYLQIKLSYLCPCVICGYLFYPVTQTQSSKFAFKTRYPCVTCGYPITQT